VLFMVDQVAPTDAAVLLQNASTLYSRMKKLGIRRGVESSGGEITAPIRRA